MTTKKQVTINTSMAVDAVIQKLEKAIKNKKVVCTGITGHPGTLQVVSNEVK